MSNVISLCDYRQKKLDELASYTRAKRRFIDEFVRDLEMTKEMSYNVTEGYDLDTTTFSLDLEFDDDEFR
jgi:hypothetical protein